MRNINRLIFLTSLINLLFLQNGFTAIDASLDSLIQKSVRLTIEQKYDSALVVGEEIITHYPTHPAGYLFLAATLQTQMMDFETDTREKEFYAYLDTALVLAKKRVENYPEDAHAHFFLGSVYCYESFYKAKQSQYWDAFRDVKKGMPPLNRAVELDSSFADAYLGLGSYLFWRSQKTRSLNWLPFLSDERGKGISMIWRSILEGKYSRLAAINGLAWIYIDLKDYDKAIEVALMGHRDFPQSRYFLWCLAEANFRKGACKESRTYFQDILLSITSDIPVSLNNHYNEVICHQKLAQCAFELKQYGIALNHCNVVENFVLDPNIENRLEKRLKSLKKLKESCQEQNETSSLVQSTH